MEAPKIFQNSLPSDNMTANNAGATENFIVEDLLDFSNDEEMIGDTTTFDSIATNSTDSSTITAIDSCNSSLSSGDISFVTDFASQNLVDGQFSSDFWAPQGDDLAELEWLSNFVEESFSSEDQQKLQLISGMKASNDAVSEARDFHSLEPTRNSPIFNNLEESYSSEDLQKLELISGIKAPNDAVSEAPKFHSVEPNRSSPIFNTEVSVPAKARSKRTRGPPCNWTSRLLVLSPTTSSSEPDLMVPMPTNAIRAVPVTGKKPAKATPKRKDGGDGNGDGRKCLHCLTDKTPQWRTGPMGPKTLCNACGVRYKSGRLVPEYRPAASPTFVLTKHSNSHRKVLELRRQKEMVRSQKHQPQQLLHHHQNIMFDVTNGDDYLIHQHVGPDFTQLI